MQYIIVNKNISLTIKKSLDKWGEVVLFETKDITYPQVSCHPDLFFCTGNNKLVTAPNIPEKYIRLLKKQNIDFITGSSPVGTKYPTSARYNAVITEQYFIHNLSVTDPILLKTFSDLEQINIPQGYGRCSLLPLKSNNFITSDRGIEKALTKKGLMVLYVNPEGILLHGFKHGFFGGTAGVVDNKVFFMGSLKYFKEGQKVKTFLKELNYNIVELYDGSLFDGGSLLFLSL